MYDKVVGVRRIFLLLLVLLLTVFVADSYAFWMWTPESNKWINPKYAVKETPKEQLDYAMEFYQLEDYDKAVAEFRKLIKHYPRSRQAADAQYFIGETLETQGFLYTAFTEYQQVVEKYPYSERSSEIVGKQFDIGKRLMEGEGRRGKWARMVAGDYDVVDVFRTVIKNAPYGEFSAPAQYKIGLYLHEKKLYQEARDEFEKVMNDYPDTEWAKAAKYQIALVDAARSAGAQYDQEITAAAVEEFEEFVKTYPEAELSTNAQQQIQDLREKEAENNFVIAKFYEKQKKYKAAKIYYDSVVSNYRDTTWAPKALEKIQEINKLIK